MYINTKEKKQVDNNAKSANKVNNFHIECGLQLKSA